MSKNDDKLKKMMKSSNLGGKHVSDEDRKVVEGYINKMDDLDLPDKLLHILNMALVISGHIYTNTGDLHGVASTLWASRKLQEMFDEPSAYMKNVGCSVDLSSALLKKFLADKIIEMEEAGALQKILNQEIKNPGKKDMPPDLDSMWNATFGTKN